MTTLFFDEDNSDLGDAEFNQQLARFETEDKTKLGVIFIEDISDKNFWEKIAFNHLVNLYSQDGKAITGKSKLLQICSANQLIAIDSDFDDLCPQHRPESILCSEKKAYILQTYAHGLENIVFSPECLREILDSKFKLYLDNHDNPILEIFQKLSTIWFEPYRKFLFLFNQNQYQYDNWIKDISLEKQECQDIVSKMDFFHYQNRMLELDKQLNQYIENQVEFDDFCEHLRQKDFTEQNVWGFIHCHDFEKQFVFLLLNLIKTDRFNKEKQYIKEGFQSQEIGNQSNKVANLFNDKMDTKTVLHHYFYDVYFPKAKEANAFLRKIVADYAKIIQAA